VQQQLETEVDDRRQSAGDDESPRLRLQRQRGTRGDLGHRRKVYGGPEGLSRVLQLQKLNLVFALRRRVGDRVARFSSDQRQP